MSQDGVEGRKQDQAASRWKVQPTGRARWRGRKGLAWWKHGELPWKGWRGKWAQFTLTWCDVCRNADFRAIQSHWKDWHRGIWTKLVLGQSPRRMNCQGTEQEGAPVTEPWLDLTVVLRMEGGTEMLRNRLWCVPVRVLQPVTAKPSNSKSQVFCNSPVAQPN